MIDVLVEVEKIAKIAQLRKTEICKEDNGISDMQSFVVFQKGDMLECRQSGVDGHPFELLPDVLSDAYNDGLDEFEEVIHTDRKAIENIGANNPRNRTGTPKANFHPTVKPVALMRYLVKLITPTGGMVLDPFMGSGSTGVACTKENFNFTGIELDLEYFKIAEARINSNLNK